MIAMQVNGSLSLGGAEDWKDRMDVWGKHTVGFVIMVGGNMRDTGESALGACLAECGIYCWLVLVPIAHLAFPVCKLGPVLGYVFAKAARSVRTTPVPESS